MRIAGLSRGTAHYRSRRNDDVLREDLRTIAGERRRFGYRRLAIMLRRKGHHYNLKKIYRLYREEGLMVRRRKGRKRALGTRQPLPKPDRINQACIEWTTSRLENRARMASQRVSMVKFSMSS